MHVVDSPHSEIVRTQALLALADIDPSHPAIQKLMVRELGSTHCDLRFAATYGVACGEYSPTNTITRLGANLDPTDPYLALITVWAIGKMGAGTDVAVPDILTALSKLHWLRIEHNELPDDEWVNIRPDFGETLGQSLPEIDDSELEDFRLRFFLQVFHPSPVAETGWIDELVRHPWYLKLQRRRFGHPADKQERQRIQELVSHAQAKFALRLWKNPTLGMRPDDYRALPGFVKMHTRSIASDLQRQRKRGLAQTGCEHLASVADRRQSDMLMHLGEFIETRLPPQERDVARLRWLLGSTVEETAAALHIKVSQVKYRTRKALKKAIAESKSDRIGD